MTSDTGCPPRSVAPRGDLLALLVIEALALALRAFGGRDDGWVSRSNVAATLRARRTQAVRATRATASDPRKTHSLLELHRDDDERSASTSRSPACVGRAARSIVIVDDDGAIASRAAAQLANQGFCDVTAPGGARATVLNHGA